MPPSNVSALSPQEREAALSLEFKERKMQALTKGGGGGGEWRAE
jgi:hypothetical protein